MTAASVAPHMWARVVKNLDRQTHEPPAWAGAPATAMPGRYALLAAAARVVPASTSVLARRALFLALRDSNTREVESVTLVCLYVHVCVRACVRAYVCVCVSLLGQYCPALPSFVSSFFMKASWC